MSLVECRTTADIVYIVVTTAEHLFVGVYASRERAEYMVRNSGMPKDTYQVIAQGIVPNFDTDNRMD